MHDRALRHLLLALLAVTVIALAWNQFGMDRVLVIDGATSLPVTAADDRGLAGGRSVGTVSREGRRLDLDCDIQPGFRWPFCELVVTLRAAPQGLDLDDYDRVRLWISASGPESRQRVRIVLRNFDPAYSTPGDRSSEKFQSIVYEPAGHPPGSAVPRARFGVADWWLDAHPLVPEQQASDFRHVVSLAVMTGPRLQPGLHHVSVERIELQGKWVSPTTLRLVLLVAWLSGVAAWLAYDRLDASEKLRLSTSSQLTMQRLNESLRLETRSLARSARTDALTGVLNRRGLAEELVRLSRLAGDGIFPLTLLFIDIDHFRRINDEWGHATGDQVIRELAVVVRAAVQRDDLFARWGGEEFLLVFRDMRALEARGIAERLRDRIAGHAWPASLVVTCSFGIAEWHRGEDLNDGVRRADEAMYRAKQGGRNRVELQLEAAPGEARRD